MADKPLVSVVLTSYTTDRLSDLYELLDSIKYQSYPNIELIFVAERTPDLMDKVKDYVRQKDIIKTVGTVFNDGKPGLSTARNLGMKEATGDIIAFTDDDVVLFSDWAEEMVKTYDDDSIIGVTGPALPLWEEESMSWLPEEFYWIISCSAWCEWDKITDVRNTWGMNMSFRKEAFAVAGAFLADIGGIHGKRLHSEEVELSQRIKRGTKKRIVFNPEVRVRHKVYKYRLTTKYIAKTSYWMGYTRQGLKKLCDEKAEGGNLLNTEHRLLRNILTRVPIDILKTFFRNPAVAWQKFRVTVTALFFVAWGYYSYSLQSLFHRERA